MWWRRGRSRLALLCRTGEQGGCGGGGEERVEGRGWRVMGPGQSADAGEQGYGQGPAGGGKVRRLTAAAMAAQTQVGWPSVSSVSSTGVRVAVWPDGG
jgi:hypothetical protein